jgi:hypothetical protein
MPRPRGFDLDELLATWQSGDFETATEVAHHLGIDHKYLRSVQENIAKYFGPRPKRPPAKPDPLRDVVVREMVARGLDENYCFKGHYSGFRCLIRQLVRDGGLDTLVFVCRRCKRAGDR